MKKMKINYRGFLIKIDFVGDSITRVYRFRLYKKKKIFHELVWEYRMHEDKIESINNACNFVIEKYKKSLTRWTWKEVE